MIEGEAGSGDTLLLFVHSVNLLHWEAYTRLVAGARADSSASWTRSASSVFSPAGSPA